MSPVHPLRPALIVNRFFMQEFLAAETPCVALGMVEERQRLCSMLALRLDVEGLAVLRTNRIHLGQATTTEEQYHQALASFATHPDPAGILLHWVCRDNVACVDLTTNRIVLTPA